VRIKKIIWMEMLLLGSSILIFRSVWTFLDAFRWAREGTGLMFLLVGGIAAAIFALMSIHASENNAPDQLCGGKPKS